MIDIIYYNKGLKRTDFDIKKLKRLSKYPVWIDCVSPSKKDLHDLKKLLRLHPLTEVDLIKLNTRIKVEEYKNYLFMVFYGIQKDKTFNMIEIDFVLGKKFLITSHKEPVENFDMLKKDVNTLSSMFKKGLDFLAHQLIDYELDHFYPTLELLDDEIEKIQMHAITNPNPKILTNILKMKRELIPIKKVVMYQRDKIGELSKHESKYISKETRYYFRDSYDTAIRVSDFIDFNRESIAASFDAYMSSMSNKTNNIMKVLSIIATVMLPLTFFTGIYGMNFDLLPGKHNPYGFWFFTWIMVILVMFMLYFFRRQKWI